MQLEEVAQSSIITFRHLAAPKQIELELINHQTGGLPPVSGDEKSLRRIFNNLITDNAGVGLSLLGFNNADLVIDDIPLFGLAWTTNLPVG